MLIPRVAKWDRAFIVQISSHSPDLLTSIQKESLLPDYLARLETCCHHRVPLVVPRDHTSNPCENDRPDLMSEREREQLEKPIGNRSPPPAMAPDSDCLVEVRCKCRDGVYARTICQKRRSRAR